MPDFIKRDLKTGPSLPDAGKSKAARRAWGRNRSTYMAGIKDFHKSLEGRRLHRKLGRFNATRTTLPKSEYRGSLVGLRKELHPDLLKEGFMEIRERFDAVNWQVDETVNEQSVVDGKHILARVVGEGFLVDACSQNKRRYTRGLWEKQFDKKKKQLESGLIGTVGHDQGLDEKAILEGKVSHLVSKLWIDESGKRPVGMIEIKILNTPAGQIMNTLMRAGVKIPVSSRAFGSYKGKGPDNVDMIDEDSFDLQTFDFVLSPGVETAYPGIVEELTRKEGERPMDINEATNNALVQRLTASNLDLQTQIAEVIKENDALRAQTDTATKQLSESTAALVKTRDMVSFYRKHVGDPASLKRLDEGLRKWLELEPMKSRAVSSGLLGQFGADPETTIKKLLSLTEAYNRFGTLDELEKLVEAKAAYAAKGTVEEIQKLMKLAENYMQFGSPEKVKAVVESNRAYKKLGTHQELTKVFGIVEKYLTIGSPTQISEKLNKAKKFNEQLRATQKKAVARRIAEHFNIPVKGVLEQLQFGMPVEKVIELEKARSEMNSIGNLYKVTESAPAAKGKIPNKAITRAESVFENMR